MMLCCVHHPRVFLPPSPFAPRSAGASAAVDVPRRQSISDAAAENSNTTAEAPTPSHHHHHFSTSCLLDISRWCREEGNNSNNSRILSKIEETAAKISRESTSTLDRAAR